MDIAISLYPIGEQIEALLAAPDEGPVVMVNLLRFKHEGDPPHENLSGEEAYTLYADEGDRPLFPKVEKTGTVPFFRDRVDGRGGVACACGGRRAA
jgi:hypothetical protein